MKIIYRIDGADFFGDRTEGVVLYKGMKVIIYAKTFVIEDLTIDYHCEDTTLEVEVIADLKNPLSDNDLDSKKNS
jgi:membrane-bound inhibitor of C-type lysozyme